MKNFPRSLFIVGVAYLGASLGHFVHNAEFIDEYPNLPRWLTREQIYLAWIVTLLPCLMALLAWTRGQQALTYLLFAIWGCLGYLGLDHYYVAPLSAHTKASNFTIIFEVFAGTVLLVTSVVCLIRLYAPPKHVDP